MIERFFIHIQKILGTNLNQERFGFSALLVARKRFKKKIQCFHT
jgi:hypothetical protein